MSEQGPQQDAQEPPFLSVRDLRLQFDTFDGVYQAIDGISFDVAAGESLGIVGETGCGKSVTAKTIIRLLPSPPAQILNGEILFGREDLLKVDDQRMRAIRGNDIAMIFQDPMTYLNPVFSIGTQLMDVIKAHRRTRKEQISNAEARDYAIEMLRKVHLPNPEQQLASYPHQLSGGMRQRVLIAMALSGQPRLLIADEPTTALDVTIQSQILDLIGELQSEFGLSVVMITHDLGVVASVCDRVLVMYAGQIVEDASIAAMFDHPAHPYTKGLLAAVPHPGRAAAKLSGIPGSLPNLLHPPDGCRFQGRCELAGPDCAAPPPMVALGRSQQVACWRVAETARAGD